MNKFDTIAQYYDLHRSELIGFATVRLGNRCEAEDVVHDAFLRIMTNQALISPVTLPCLVHTVVRRLVTDRFRHRSVEQQYEHRLHTSAAAADDVESVFSASEITEQLERCIARLPENCRNVYRLHIYGGMKTAEISQTTGEAYRSVEHRLGIARKQVRQHLQYYCATAT